MYRVLILMFSCASAFSQSYDMVIGNGKIIDGTGNSWFYGDVAIKDGKIISIGKFDRAQTQYYIDAKGLMVAPGFIDVHTHVESSILNVPTADNFVLDGVTSVITGNCGGSSVDIKSFFNRLDSIRTSVNLATLVGHNSVRAKVMGESDRDPSPEEQLKMEKLVEECMQNGAVGLSTGLIYLPGMYSKTPEVVGLAKAAARHGGVYASHIRSEGFEVTQAIEEAINIGRQANIPVEISHFKVTYKPNWGRSEQTLAQVEKARQEGIDVTIDQYPYVASSTTLSTTLPNWALSGGLDSVRNRLANPDTRMKIKKEMVAELQRKELKNFSYAVVARYQPDSTYNGLNISEINKRTGRKPKAIEEAETILELVASTERVQMVFFSMNEKDLQRIMQYPFNMFASDAGVNRFGSGMPHPRAYGTNSKVLGTYVRELKLIRLEEAIRRMTSLPAAKFKLHDRGLLREGMAADIVIFDEKTVSDRATYQKPHAYAVGFKYVIINGAITAQDGRHTGERKGQVLKSRP